MSLPAHPTVLITGAARRIGKAIALDLGANGWRVAVHFNTSRAEAEAVAQAIVAGGGKALALQADLGDTAALSQLVSSCASRLSPPTCLVNNASEFELDTLATMTPESWRQHIDVNLRAPIFLAQQFARLLPPEAQGNVVNLIDQRVLRTTPEFLTYSLSKSALWTATRMLAQELAPRIRVNAIGPGPVLRSIHQTEADFEAERASTLLRRGSTPEEIAAAVRFILASPAMTGQMIALDGGQHLG